LLVDLHGWFADPRPVLPVRSFTRTSALQLSPRPGAAVGPIEYAYTDNLGSLISGRQAEPTNFFGVQYTVVSNGEAFTGQPALAEQADQRTQLIGQVANGGDIWSRTRAGAESTDWPSSVPWVAHGGSLTGAPVVGKLGDGRLVQFGVDSDGRLWQLAQATPSGAYPGWRSLGDVDLAGAPAVVAVRDGNLQLFATTATGAVRTATYFASGSLSAWTDLGGTVAPGSLAAVVYPGFRLRIVGLSGTEVVTKAQNSTGGWPAGWETLSGFAPAGAPTAVLSPQDGRTYVLVRGADGGIYRIAETAQASGTWGTWDRAIDAATTVATDPTAFVYSDGAGTKWAFVARDASQTIIFFVQSTGPFAAARRLPEVRK
jgi:YD repeat-containing protein